MIFLLVLQVRLELLTCILSRIWSNELGLVLYNRLELWLRLSLDIFNIRLTEFKTSLYLVFCITLLLPSTFPFQLYLTFTYTHFDTALSTCKMSCSQCFENPPTLSPTYGAGTVQEFWGLQTYVTGSPLSKLAILLISDIFGTILSYLSFFLQYKNSCKCCILESLMANK